MNKKQLVVMWLAIGLICLMCLFPPWRYHHFDGETGIDTYIAGPYRLLFLGPPGIPFIEKDNPGWSYDNQREVYTNYDFKGYPHREWRVELDKHRIIIPGIVLIVLSVGLLVSFYRPKPFAK